MPWIGKWGQPVLWCGDCRAKQNCEEKKRREGRLLARHAEGPLRRVVGVEYETRSLDVLECGHRRAGVPNGSFRKGRRCPECRQKEEDFMAGKG